MSFDFESPVPEPPAPDAPAAASAGQESPSGPRRAIEPDETARPHSAVGWTILGTILPGVGLWRAGRRIQGGIAFGLFVVLVGGLATLAITQRSLLVSWAAQPVVLTAIAIALLVLGVSWVILIANTYLALRPSQLSTGQRIGGAALVTVLSFLVAAPMAFGANLAYTVAGTVNSIFGNNQTATRPTITNVADPWADKARLNVLLLGGDHDSGRSEALGNRADTVIVASIDTATGATTLFSLPRNTARMPFPEDSPLHKYYPNGFYDGVDPANAEYFLNAMPRNVPTQVPADILGETDYLGADVTKISVGEALGLDIDYYVEVNMDGFKDFINAIGGITVNVNYRVPIGGQTDAGIEPDGWIEPGPNQHMNGRRALWFARGRYGLDDYKRMARQQCVIEAVVQQANPANLLANYEKVAQAGEKTLRTDIPSDMLPALVELATRVQGTKLRSIVFQTGKNGWVSANPNWDQVRAQVKKALKETSKSNKTSTASTSASPSATATPTTSATSKPSSSPTTTKTSTSGDLSDACAYNPEP